MPKPFLSIGIIFKNEIRCLERCLSSLTPLRLAIPCELVMADTGSSDGSREVAERYADILIDFPWINDFSAARNAVMDRCTGRWHFTMDADEWLDEDVSELVKFLRTNNRKELEACSVRVRNYVEADNYSDYSDFCSTRMLRMSTGIRYQGAVHEIWKRDDGEPFNSETLFDTILHHDGYVGLNSEAGKARRERNQALLEERLKENPDSVRLLLQYIESSRPDPQHEEYLRRGLEAVEGKKYEWQAFGPVVFRYAVLAARERGLPELEEWIARAEKLFPASFYTTIDIACLAFLHYWESMEYEKCIRWGEKYLAAMEDYDAGRGDRTALLVSTLLFTAPKWGAMLRTVMISACAKAGQPARALELLEKFEPLSGNLVGEALKNLQELQVSTGQDTSAHMLRLYERITSETDEARAKELMTAFLQTAPLAFGPDVREAEAAREDFHRYSYTIFLPLAGKCEVGTAAAVMEAESVKEIDRLLGMVEKWGDFSVSALIYALEAGAAFPPAGKIMAVEEMERIAKRLAQYQNRFFDVVCQTAPQQCDGSWQQLIWARSLVRAAVQNFNWTDEARGLALAETFANVEGTFVFRCYTPEVLCSENIHTLPPLHRFGWYCSMAFAALEAEDTAGYVQLLREGLDTCPEMKVMVAFLMEHTPQLRPQVSGELLSLAEQVRTLLSAYSPDDPAVVMIKQSAAYQKVASLIEGSALTLAGRLSQ